MIKIKSSEDNQFYFVVTAKNGQVLVTSETYKTKQALNKGIEALGKIFEKINKTVGIVGVDESKKPESY